MSINVCGFIIITQNWKQPQCPSTGEWINKPWYTYTTEHYSAIKRNEQLIHLRTWMNLRYIMVKWKKPDLGCKRWFHLQWYSRKGKSIGTKNRSEVARALGQGRGGFCGRWNCFISWLWWWYNHCLFVKTWRTVYWTEKLHWVTLLKNERKNVAASR